MHDSNFISLFCNGCHVHIEIFFSKLECKSNEENHLRTFPICDKTVQKGKSQCHAAVKAICSKAVNADKSVNPNWDFHLDTAFVFPFK